MRVHWQNQFPEFFLKNEADKKNLLEIKWCWGQEGVVVREVKIDSEKRERDS